MLYNVWRILCCTNECVLFRTTISEHPRIQMKTTPWSTYLEATENISKNQQISGDQQAINDSTTVSVHLRETRRAHSIVKMSEHANHSFHDLKAHQSVKRDKGWVVSSKSMSATNIQLSEKRSVKRVQRTLILYRRQMRTQRSWSKPLNMYRLPS